MTTRANTFLFSANAPYIEALYADYITNPNSVDPSWVELFQFLGDTTPPKRVTIAAQHSSSTPMAAVSSNDDVRALVKTYRRYGHYQATLDPLGLTKPYTHAMLAKARAVLSDKTRLVSVDNLIPGMGTVSVGDLCAFLEQRYTGTLGIEYEHIDDVAKREWLRQAMEGTTYWQNIEAAWSRTLLTQLIHVEAFEQFLHTRFPGAKRFSIEGCDTTITALEVILQQGSAQGMTEAIIGMAHRGRLSVLTSILQKPYHAMLAEFKGATAHPEELRVAGDVKYHMGYSHTRSDANQHQLHVSLTPNPSHLEAVNPVVLGKVRARQTYHKDHDRHHIIGILLHGDAAFAGQGIVAETLNMSQLEGYTTGGTIHIVTNNQVGFTTNPKEARSMTYASDMAKMINAPVIHVNADDPEAVIRAARMAIDFRTHLHQDIVIDIIGYRRYGHNETDEPSFTQPVMYHMVNEKPTVAAIWADTLTRTNVVSKTFYKEERQAFTAFLEKELEAAEKYKPKTADWLEGKWSGLSVPPAAPWAPPETAVDLDTLKQYGHALSTAPTDIQVNYKIARQLEARRTMIDKGEGIDWGTGEALAFASILAENIPIRLAGQDVGRGTFSHRHAVLVDQKTEQRRCLLNHVAPSQASMEIVNSLLSEYGALGFEYGYSLSHPQQLVLWEAQFGDFANGAQIVIDQFIASGETKWLRTSGLVLLLPHGYEGQGPEHSSARLERFLQLCAEDNMQVVNCSTPANYFHALRRQVSRPFRKPLIVMSPKSLLRHKLAVSRLADCAAGTQFLPVIGDSTVKEAKKIVICSGKVYYDLWEQRAALSQQQVALIRLEEFYPFPAPALAVALKPHGDVPVVWCQEEPANMGAWMYVASAIRAVREGLGHKTPEPLYAGRPAAASPAVGYARLHKEEQDRLIAKALSLEPAACSAKAYAWAV